MQQEYHRINRNMHSQARQSAAPHTNLNLKKHTDFVGTTISKFYVIYHSDEISQ